MTHATLTPTVIKYLMSIPKMMEEFPFLRFASKSLKDKEKRSCCGKKRRSAQAPSQVIETVKASIAHLPPERIALIKKALNADTLTIYVSVNGKETVHKR